MTRTLSFIITGPPTLAIGTFVAVVDDETGASVDAGWWQHDGTHWRYSMPYEFAPRLVTAPPDSNLSDSLPREIAVPQDGRDPRLQQIVRESDAILANRRRLKEAVKAAASAPRKEDLQQAATIPAHWESCPSPGCHKRFDPATNELLTCSNCGEDRSTACCLPDPVRPCLDCQALGGAAEENEMVGAPPAGALFDGVFRPDPRKMAEAQAAGDDVQEEDE